MAGNESHLTEEVSPMILGWLWNSTPHQAT
jgi:hypothetical protein